MKKPKPGVEILLFLLVLAGCSTASKQMGVLPEGFVYLQDVAPSILQEMRYAQTHNFVGKPIVGYLAEKCILTQSAAKALASVQTELLQYGMSLKVYECYRPQRAVDSFVAWAKDLNDNKMKKEFFPKVEKMNLFRDGYIAEKSGHSRGSTVDLTVVSLPVSKQEQYHEGQRLRECTLSVTQRFKDNTLDFGTGYDCFDPLSHTANPQLSLHQKQNRLMLKSLMEKNGFKNLAEEWWHYTLRAEPFANRYFDFLVQ
jgi:D-alanyl-D-alanine dipeptidase